MEYYETCWVYHIIVAYNVVSHGFPYYLILSHGKSVQIPYHLSHVSTAASHCGFL